VKIGRRIRKGRSLPPIIFNLSGDYVIKGALEFGDFEITGQIIRIV